MGSDTNSLSVVNMVPKHVQYLQCHRTGLFPKEKSSIATQSSLGDNVSAIPPPGNGREPRNVIKFLFDLLSLLLVVWEINIFN